MSDGSESCPEKSMNETLRSEPSTKTIARTPIANPASGVRTRLCRSTTGRIMRAIRLIPAPTTAAAMSDRDRPEELGSGRAARGRDVGDRERERPETGPGVEPDKDERTHAGRDQARDQDHAQQGTAQAGHFHQEEGADDRRAEQGRDRGEAPGHPEDHDRHRRRVALEEVDGQDTETAADRDQGRLRTEDDPEAQGREGGQHDPREARSEAPARWP